MIDAPVEPRAPRSKALVVVSLLILALLAGIGYRVVSQPKQQAEGRGRMLRPVPVLVGDVRAADMPVRLSAIGTVEAVETVSVRAQASGQVLEVGFQEGHPVTKGQVLYRLDPAPLQAALAQAQAALARDRAQLVQAQADARRYQDLLAQGFVSRQQAEQMSSSVAALEATVQADQAMVENARVQLSYATITSPLSGVAGDRAIDVGNLVRAGDITPLVVINRVSPVRVSFTVPQGEIDRIRRFQAQAPIRVEATPRGGRTVSGKVVFLDNAVDPSTGTLRLKAEFPNESGTLVPGQFADVVLTLTTERGRIVAPAQSVQPSQKGHYAFVVNPDETVSQRHVTVDRMQDDLAVVTAGLEPGERVVIDGMLQLRDGGKVEVRKELAPPPPSEGRGPGGGPGQGGAERGGSTHAGNRNGARR